MPEDEVPPTASQPLATPQQLEDATNGKIKHDAKWVDEALAAASKAVRNHCRWHVAPVITETLTLDARGSRLLLLPSAHVRQINSLTQAGVALTPDLDFEWSTNGVLERAWWARKRRGIEINLEHGYALDEIPDIVDLVISLAARRVYARLANVVKEQAGTNMLQLGTVGGTGIGIDLLPHELSKLDAYSLTGRNG